MFIEKENTPPGHWPLARVVRTFPDKYGVNRVCEVQTSKSNYKKPSVKLVLLLPVERDSEATPAYLEAPVSHLVLLQAAVT